MNRLKKGDLVRFPGATGDWMLFEPFTFGGKVSSAGNLMLFDAQDVMVVLDSTSTQGYIDVLVLFKGQIRCVRHVTIKDIEVISEKG